MGEPLQVVADIPTESPGLGFPEYVEAIADAIRGGQPAQFTIGIYGPWGTGKSSILRALELRLTEEPDVTPAFFDAWRYEQTEHIIVPMLHTIHRALIRMGREDIAKQLMRALRAVVSGLNFKIVNIKDAEESWEKQGLTPLDIAFSRPFDELRALPEALGGGRIAVLVDDLDRCSDRNVVALLEAINLVMDVPGLIFVLALDYDVLVRAIERKYDHVSGHAFIEKLVQIPFRVPPLTIYDRSSLEELVPTWTSSVGDLPDHFSDRVVDIAVLGLQGNPRQVKRLLNSFLILRRIMDRRRLPVDYLLLAALIGLQLRWPAEHQRLHDAVRVSMQGAESDPLLAATDDGAEPALVAYLNRFVRELDVPTEALWRTLQLTTVVSPEREPELDPFAEVADGTA